MGEKLKKELKWSILEVKNLDGLKIRPHTGYALGKVAPVDVSLRLRLR